MGCESAPVIVEHDIGALELSSLTNNTGLCGILLRVAFCSQGTHTHTNTHHRRPPTAPRSYPPRSRTLGLSVAACRPGMLITNIIEQRPSVPASYQRPV